MAINTDPQKIKEILERGVEEVIDKSHLEAALKSGKKLRVKLGIDPTGPKIHIGRAIVLWKLRAFQELGHQIVLIIGDFTGQVGDASDKDSMRKCLSEKEIKENMKDYENQIGKILDMKKVEVRKNSEWLGKLSFKEYLGIAQKFTAQQLIQRRNFKERWDSENPIGLHELNYPLMQGYDSVAIKAGVELGGFDQLFNLKTGRDMQRIFNQEPQDILITKMLNGLDGRKMSTSWGNVITIVDTPNDMFGKIMSMRDELMGDYFELCSQLPMAEVAEIKQDLQNGTVNPRDMKVKLALEIVRLYHGEKAATESKEEFNRVFKSDGAPSIMPKWRAKKHEYPILNLLTESGLIASKSEAKRLILGNAVEIFYPKEMKSAATNEKFPMLDLDKCEKMLVTDWTDEIRVENDMIVKIGKRKFVQIKL